MPPPVVGPGARAMTHPAAGPSGEPSPGRTRFALRRPGSAPRRSDRVACAETSRESPRPPARRGLPAPARAVAKCSPHLPRATFPVNDLPIAPNRAPLPDSPLNDPWTPRATSSGRGGAWSAMHFRRNRAPFPPRTGISSVPLFTWRRKGSLARGHLPGNPPRTSQDRDPGGHIWGKSPQPAPIEGGTIFPDGRERNICHFMDGNRLCANPAPRFGGELATNELYAHFEAGMGRALPASNPA